MICKYCGNVIADGSDRCSVCGALPIVEADTVIEIEKKPFPTTDPGKNLGIISIALGIAGMLICICCSFSMCFAHILADAMLLGIVAFIFGSIVELISSAAGIFLGISSRKKSSEAQFSDSLGKIGIIVSAAAVVLNVVVLVLCGAVIIVSVIGSNLI